MATIDSSYVERELRAVIASSQAVRSAVRRTLERLEQDPSTFPELEWVPPAIRREFPDVTLRKIAIRSGRHDYRLVVAHWRLEEGREHVDVLYAFRRRKGYAIDWDWVDSVLRDDA
jgi:hypothetical protein